MPALLLSVAFQIPSFQRLDELIENHRNDTQYNDGHNHPCQLENLAAINNQIPKPDSGGDELTDDYSDQTQSDVYLHNAEQGRDISGNHHLE